MSAVAISGCLALAALAIWISARWFGHPFSPFSVFYGIWFTALALYNLHWIDYIPIRQPAWTLIVLSLATFGMGWIIPYLAWNPRDYQGPEAVVHDLSAERLRIVILICFVLGVIWAVTFLRVIQSSIGVAAFIEAPSEIRGAAIDEPLKFFDWLNVANVTLCSFYLFILNRKRSPLIWLVLLFSAAALFLMQDRIHFFYAFSWAGFVLLHSMKVTAKRVAGLVAVGVVLLLSQFLLVAIWLGKVVENNPVLMEIAEVEDASALALPPYLYLTESFPSLQAYLDSSPRPTHGSMTFYPAFKVLNLIDPTLEPPHVVPEFLQVPFESNTFTWLQQFYDDFGTAGVVIGPWLIGVLTSALYFHMLKTRSFYSTLMNGVFCFCFALSIFANHFTQGPAWYFAVVCFLIALWIEKPVHGLTPAVA